MVERGIRLFGVYLVIMNSCYGNDDFSWRDCDAFLKNTYATACAVGNAISCTTLIKTSTDFISDHAEEITATATAVAAITYCLKTKGSMEMFKNPFWLLIFMPES